MHPHGARVKILRITEPQISKGREEAVGSAVKRREPGHLNACVQILFPPQISSVTLGELLNFSVSQLPLL